MISRRCALYGRATQATEIVQFAMREGVSLIMMPTLGSGIFRRLLLGSVTAKVLHDAPCPVWTTSHSEHVTPARYPYRTVACAVDLSSRSEETVRWASQFASEQNAKLHVVHAIDIDEKSTDRLVLQARQYLCTSVLERWQQLEKQLGFEVPFHTAYGSVRTGVRKAAHDLEADIVIIGRGRLQEPLGRLRTNSYAIIRESPCPLISV
jgi:nucleotide-binding universal stress UspA family protein